MQHVVVTNRTDLHTFNHRLVYTGTQQSMLLAYSLYTKMHAVIVNKANGATATPHGLGGAVLRAARNGTCATNIIRRICGQRRRRTETSSVM